MVAWHPCRGEGILWVRVVDLGEGTEGAERTGLVVEEEEVEEEVDLLAVELLQVD